MRRHSGTNVLMWLLAAALSGCGETEPERAAFLTLMGNDTLAVEWVEFDDDEVHAKALVRGTRTTYHEYDLELEDGTPTRWEARVWEGGAPDGDPARSEELVMEDGERVLVTRRDGEEDRRAFPEDGVVPFVDMLHWPFEAALRDQARRGVHEDVATFSGRGMSFGLIDNGDGTWGLRHPSRGVSTFEMDAEGRILRLDGTGSTRAYDLRRIGWDDLDPAEAGRSFGDRPLGDLSGRGQIDDRVAGVSFTGDYGQPLKRGRDIFGGLLAYGTWWRTGANRATHFSFDRDIVIDGERIPAGDYTLSSIPEEDGGTLIINTQTEQGGQTYDEALDQARVRLRREASDQTVEAFEIRVVPTEGRAGRIELRWDDTVYWVPFEVP